MGAASTFGRYRKVFGMKKFLGRVIAITMTAVCALGLGACGNAGVQEGAGKVIVADNTDSIYVQNKGKLVVGISDSEPFTYKVKGGWEGIDADLAKIFALTWLETDCEFVLVNRDDIQKALTAGLIDCYWCGMKNSDELANSYGVSFPYLYNKQVIVVNVDDENVYETVDDLKGKKIAVVAGSDAETAVKNLGLECVAAETEPEALFYISAGKADVVCISGFTAYDQVGADTDYPDLRISGLYLGDESYVVLFRKNSSLCEQFNVFFYENREDFTERTQNYGALVDMVPSYEEIEGFIKK